MLLLVLLKGVRDPAIQYSRNLALSALFLLAVFILLPRIVFGSAYADMRLAPFMIGIAVIALRPRPGCRSRGAAVMALLGLAFFLARTAGTTISYWHVRQELRPRTRRARQAAGRRASWSASSARPATTSGR